MSRLDEGADMAKRIKPGLVNAFARFSEEVIARLPTFGPQERPPSRTPIISGEGRPLPGSAEEATLAALLKLGGVDKQVCWRDGSFLRYDEDGKVHCHGAPAIRNPNGREIWFEHGRKLEAPASEMTPDQVAGPRRLS